MSAGVVSQLLRSLNNRNSDQSKILNTAISGGDPGFNNRIRKLSEKQQIQVTEQSGYENQNLATVTQQQMTEREMEHIQNQINGESDQRHVS